MSSGKLALVYFLNLVAHVRALALREARIVERGWWDQIVDPTRYRLGDRSVAFARALGRRLPRADVGVILSGDSALIHERKPELSPDEIAACIASWRVLLPAAAKRVVEADVSNSPDQIVAAILGA